MQPLSSVMRPPWWIRWSSSSSLANCTAQRVTCVRHCKSIDRANRGKKVQEVWNTKRQLEQNGQHSTWFVSARMCNVDNASRGAPQTPYSALNPCGSWAVWYLV
jgi:hypothetical protein